MTINVSRELLADLLGNDHDKRIMAERHLLAMLANAPSPAGVDADHVEDVRAMVADPSPAGVDGLEVVGWYRMDDRKAITPYPSVCATWHKMGVKVGAAYSDSAHAIIDGLRGDVEVMTQHANNYSSMFEECAEERDQQAQRIGELKGLLRSCLPALSDGGCAALANRIDAALSAGKEGSDGIP